MTADQAADILGCTESTIHGYGREKLLRRKGVTRLVPPRSAGHAKRQVNAWDYNGQDVQGMHRLRTKLGVRAGTAAWRAGR